LTDRVRLPIRCHPEGAESSAKPGTPNEGPLQAAGGAVAAGVPGAAAEYRGPSARKERGPQDDKGFWIVPRPSRRESFRKGFQELFQHVVEFLWVVDEEGVAVAFESFQAELVAQLQFQVVGGQL
jgi:hypothetical protein